jgi:hypothetical protein
LFEFDRTQQLESHRENPAAHMNRDHRFACAAFFVTTGDQMPNETQPNDQAKDTKLGDFVTEFIAKKNEEEAKRPNPLKQKPAPNPLLAPKHWP